jgi:DNA-binding beta-propeller fold protein YncE
LTLGRGTHVYEAVVGWGRHFYSPYVEVAGVGVDSRDQVYVLVRNLDPVLVFDSEGNFLRSWGRKHFTWPHSLSVGWDDCIYCTDGDHTVRKFDADGKLLMTLGTKNQHAETGCLDKGFPDFPDYRTIERAGGPFYFPTDTAIDNEGNLYISDGYGNARIHKFSRMGEHLLSWGEPGSGKGQFNLPHGICVDKQGIVYVADRENNRIQLFDSEGRVIDQWGCNRPTDLFFKDEYLYVTEMGYPTLYFRIFQARLSIFDIDGNLLSQWGTGTGCAPGSFFAPHALCVDSKYSIYVGETIISSVASLECHTLQKFVKMDQDINHSWSVSK